MLRFLHTLIAVLVICAFSQTADAGPLGRFLFRASHPFAPIGSYAGPKGIGSGFGLSGGNAAACTQQQAAPSCNGTTCTPQQVPAAPVERPTQQRHTDLHNRDAQGVANLQAHYGRVGHHGGNPGYEGCGMASTPEQAYSICCYGNSGMRTVDVGYARAANGMWFCCRRYGR